MQASDISRYMDLQALSRCPAQETCCIFLRHSLQGLQPACDSSDDAPAKMPVSRAPLSAAAMPALTRAAAKSFSRLALKDQENGFLHILQELDSAFALQADILDHRR